MKSQNYTTVAGEVIEYPTPAKNVTAYLSIVTEAAHDPRVSEGELVEMVYSKDNPILDPTIFKGRGAVTKAVLANPVYHVMQDLLFAKRIQMGTLAGEDRVAARASLTVAETAAELGISPGAVRQAIGAGNLEASKEGGRYAVVAESVSSYRARVKRRGPKAGAVITFHSGSAPGKSFRVKAPDPVVTAKEGHTRTAEVPVFRRMAVAFSGKKTNRMFVLVPSDEPNEFEFGPFWIRGHYEVAEKINDPEEASKRFKKFRAN